MITIFKIVNKERFFMIDRKTNLTRDAQLYKLTL